MKKRHRQEGFWKSSQANLIEVRTIRIKLQRVQLTHSQNLSPENNEISDSSLLPAFIKLPWEYKTGEPAYFELSSLFVPGLTLFALYAVWCSCSEQSFCVPVWLIYDTEKISGAPSQWCSSRSCQPAAARVTHWFSEKVGSLLIFKAICLGPESRKVSSCENRNTCRNTETQTNDGLCFVIPPTKDGVVISSINDVSLHTGWHLSALTLRLNEHFHNLLK